MALLCFFLHVATIIHISILAHPFLFCSHETASSCEINEWTMEDMWDIKRVLESQEDAHVKVEMESNSESMTPWPSN
jgi:hypothetical protein